MVLAIDFFGFPPSRRFLQFVQRRPDLLFVDDRAQALAPSIEPWADWTLYSPRKLLGVADGGILVVECAGRLLPRPNEQPDAVALWSAPLLRYEDRTEVNNPTWYEANRAKEARLKADGCRMTLWTAWILSHTALDPLAECRRRNWLTLKRLLGNWLACDGNPDAAPFGYVIKVPALQRAKILHDLHSDRIFATVHWPALPSPPKIFAAEHQLQRQLITLPCDHRYDEDTMACVAQKILAFLS
jgi:hypothetical protein